MTKISTVAIEGIPVFKDNQLTIGLDLGDRTSHYSSPWVSPQLAQLGHEVIVAHARNVRLIGESSRKDDRLDARTLARPGRIDPALLSPVRHRSAKAHQGRPTGSASSCRLNVPQSNPFGPHGSTGLLVITRF